MSVEVLISIQSIQNLDGINNDGPELITMGDYNFGNEGICFSYMESELTGLEGTKTKFIIHPSDEVILTRQGLIKTQMVFRLGEKHTFHYQTDIGSLKLTVFTRKLDIRLDEHGGNMAIEYDLIYEHAYLSRNKFIIKVKEKGLNS